MQIRYLNSIISSIPNSSRNILAVNIQTITSEFVFYTLYSNQPISFIHCSWSVVNMKLKHFSCICINIITITWCLLKVQILLTVKYFPQTIESTFIWPRPFWQGINSYPHTAVCMRQWTGSALVQVMRRRLLSPLPAPMLTYCQLGPEEPISVKFQSKFKIFHSQIASANIVNELAAILFSGR